MNNLVSAAVCLVFGALALAFGQGHSPNGLVLLIGIILWIRFFRLADPKYAVPLVTIANVLVWEWAYAGMVPLPTAARIGMFTGISLVFGLLFLADRWANLRLDSLLATLILPCGWAAFDLFSARFSPGGTWASIAYAFAGDTTLVQIASLAGWTGVTFLVVWLASIINWVWNRWTEDGAFSPRGLTTLALVSIAVFAFGILRLSTGVNEKMVRVACIVAPNTFNDDYVNDVWAYTRGVDVPEKSTLRAKERIEQSKEEHFSLVENALASNPDFIVWPEANAVMTTEEENSWIDRAKEIATTNHVFVGMGLVVFRPGTGKGTFNKFVLVDPTGNAVIDSLKATRVPGSLNTKGDGVLPVVESEFGRLSTAICFDMDFPQVISQAGAAKIDLFFAPSNDWLEVRDIHAQMARFRAIEQGFALVRPTKDGTTLITDSTGRTIASMVAADNRTALLVTDVPVSHRTTLYSFIGDTFGMACGLVFVLVIGFAGFKTLKPKAVI